MRLLREGSSHSEQSLGILRSEGFLPQVNYLKISLITAHLNLSKQQHGGFQEAELLTLPGKVEDLFLRNNNF